MEEMREWQQQTVSRIRKLQPDRVLEIGCGTGMLLFDRAPDCTRYVALDFSERVVRGIKEKLASRADLSHVEVEQRAAHELSNYPEHSFDLVILNSIVQYFPDANYLLRVLEGAFRLVKDGGFVFLGDLFSLPLLKAFCLSVELAHAAKSTTVAELRRRVDQRVGQVKELYLDPSFFRFTGQGTLYPIR